MSNNVLWHRVDESIEIDIDNDGRAYRLRPVYYSIPVLRTDLSGYFDYWQGNDLSVSLVIASPRIEGRHYPELMAKQSFWMIKHLCERTDAKEEGIHLQLSVDNTLRDTVMPYAEACNYPTDRINWIDSDPEMSVYYSKFEAIFSDAFIDVQRVLHMDLNFMMGWHPTMRVSRLFNRIKSAWRHRWEQHIAVNGSLLVSANPYIPSPLKKPNWDTTKHELAGFMGHDVADEVAYWLESKIAYYVPGRMWGLDESLINDSGFRDDIHALVNITGCDEISLQTYARKQNWAGGEAANLGICCSTIDLYARNVEAIESRRLYYDEYRLIHAEHTDDPEATAFWLALYT